MMKYVVSGLGFLLGFVAAIWISNLTALGVVLSTTVIFLITYSIVKKDVLFLGNTFLFIFIFSSLHVSGLLGFNFIPQAETLLGNDPIDLLMSGHQWGPRYFISYPAVLMAEWFDLYLDQAFTLYCVFFLYGITVAFSKLGANYSQRHELVFGLVAIAAVTALSLVMNGRLIPAYFGITIILLIQMSVFKKNSFFSVKQLILMFVGFFLSTVSSGTMMVSLIQLIIVTMFLLRKNGFKINDVFKAAVVYGFLFGYVMGPHVLLMVNKNLNYFGGGIEGIRYMLIHGLGQFFVNNKGLLIIVVTAAPFAYVIYKKVYKLLTNHDALTKPILICIPISLSCGLFGLSTASMVIPSLIFMAGYIAASAPSIRIRIS